MSEFVFNVPLTDLNCILHAVYGKLLLVHENILLDIPLQSQFHGDKSHFCTHKTNDIPVTSESPNEHF